VLDKEAHKSGRDGHRKKGSARMVLDKEAHKAEEMGTERKVSQQIPLSPPLHVKGAVAKPLVCSLHQFSTHCSSHCREEPKPCCLA